MNRHPYKYWQLDIENLFGEFGKDWNESSEFQIHAPDKEALLDKAKQMLAVDPFKDKQWTIKMRLCESRESCINYLTNWIWNHDKQEFVKED